MEKRRIRLEINGVVCGLITQESEDYMRSLADEVGELMTEIMEASPYITREAAALTAALSYCDDSKKSGRKAFDLQERVDELEVEAEIWQEDKDEMLKKAADDAGAELSERLKLLEQENTRLAEENEALHEKEEACLRLTDENNALRENADKLSGELKNTEELENELAKLKAENLTLLGDTESLRAALEHNENGGEPTEKYSDRLQRLEEENNDLHYALRRAEQEKQGAISAAKRAVEEAKRRMDEMERELRIAKNAAPVDKPKPEPKAKTVTSTKRKNPLRQNEAEQEGLVSFFEKKR